MVPGIFLKRVSVRAQMFRALSFEKDIVV